MKINVSKIHFKFKIKQDGNNVHTLSNNVKFYGNTRIIIDKDMIKPSK